MRRMKTWLILQGILLMTFNAKSQDPVLTKVRHQIDSSITQIQKEPDPDKRVQMLIEIHHNPLQGYPQVYLETGQRLNKLSQEMHDPRMEANSWSFMGQGYRLTGNYVKALECHQKALALAETTGNKAILAMALNEMGHIYKDREENEKALNIYFQALQNARESLVEELPVWPSMNIGVVYFNLNELDSALFYTQIAYDEFVKIGAVNNLAYVINNMASIYSKMGNKDKAMSYFHQALLPNYSTGSVRYPNLIFIAMAEHYRRFNQEDSSLFYARKAVEIVENTPFSYMSIKPARLLMDVYQNTNADSAIKYLKIYQAANDSLFSNRTNYQLQMMALEADQRKQELAAERTRFQNKIKTNILLGVLFTIGLVAFILYRNNKQKHKANLLLQQQKEEIESTLSQLRQTQTQLIQSEKMASLGEMTAGIAHEIQNPLNFVNNFSEVNSELIVELKEELAKGNMQSANELAENIRENEEKIVFHGKRADSIVKSMLLHSRSGSGQKE
ncbi:MAG TPA: tetratricopeptide repeat protein, partial [Saprospiraceae bacterium]|nr:tetratricopeptide repeat protein [Saprospiraceae bacterium]